MIGRSKGKLKGLCLLVCLGLFLVSAHADVGLIVETPTGILGFLSDVGHSSVWISHGCLNKQGQVLYCENSPGIVLSSTAYWSKTGAAAIPAELFFLGSEPGAAGRSVSAWNATLGTAYPGVDPAYGRKYLGRVWRRGMRITTFSTTPEEDRRVLASVEQQRRKYRYSYSHRNCAFYAQQVLQLYLGPEFHANHLFDLGVYTPRALERALLHRLTGDPNSSFRVFTFPGTFSESWRQPPRNFCEAALFDPKYAVPLLMFQPYVYVGFGACYGITRLTAATWHGRHSAEAPPLALMASEQRTAADPRLRTYQRLTGNLPKGPGWPLFPSFSEPQGQAQPLARPPVLVRDATDPGTPAEDSGADDDTHEIPGLTGR